MTSGCALTHGPREATSCNNGSSASRVLPWWIGSTQTSTPSALKQLLAYLVREFLVIDGRLGMDADGGELFENTVKTVVLGRRGFPRFAIATPKNRDLKVFLLGHHSSFKKGRC